MSLERLNTARVHHNMILEQDRGQIAQSVQESVVYDDYKEIEPKVWIEDTDCVSAMIDKQREYDETAITILNFASFHEPGGGYISGAWAQEESLCSESNLWEILNDEKFDSYYGYNYKHHNDGLYEHRAIFTPDVKFTRIGFGPRYCNVLTCASPNYKNAILKHSHDKIVEVYKERLKFIYNILTRERQSLLVAGAWGCGVFGFPRDISEKLFRETATIDTILAIPSDPYFKPKRRYAEAKSSTQGKE